MEKEKQEIRYGDLVRWEAGEKTRVGVVVAVDAGGTCTIGYRSAAGTQTVRIRSYRLERIVSTIEPEIPAPSEEPAPAEKPKKKAARKKKAAKGKKKTTKKKGAAKGRKKTTKKKAAGKGAGKKKATGKKKAAKGKKKTPRKRKSAKKA